MTISDTETTTVPVLAREYNLSEKQVRYRLDAAGVRKLGKSRWPLWTCVKALNKFEHYADAADDTSIPTDEQRALCQELEKAISCFKSPPN